MSKNENDKEINSRGGILSVVDLRDRIVPAKDVEKYLSLFEKRDWDGIKEFGREKENYERKFVIRDYSELNLTPFSYDLSIGHQLFSIQRPDPRVVPITDEQPYGMEPGETVIVITREYIALPPCYSATVWPRFKMVRSGIFQSMVKIDPTWYGKLAVAMSNLSPTTLKIKRDAPFGTLVLYELSKPTDVDLWKHRDLEEVDVELPEDLQSLRDRLDNFVFTNKKLQGHCRLVGNVLKIRGIKRNELEELRSFDKNKLWRDFVEVIGNTWADAKHSKTDKRMIGMEGLGMMDLEPILRGATRGERVERELIEIGECRQEELISAAIQYGKPFDLIANIPKLVGENIERESIAKIHAEVVERLFPQIVQLTIRIIALLSLIGVAVALAGQYFQGKATWLGIAALIVIPVMYAFLIWQLRNFPAGKSEPKAKRGLSSIARGNLEIEKEYRFPKLVSFVLGLLSRLKKK